MRKWLSKLFAVLLTAVMLLGIAPTLAFGADAGTTGKADDAVHIYTEEEHAAIESDVFVRIQTVKDAAAATMGGAVNMTEADFIALLPQVESAIKSSDTYVAGSLQRNGNLLIWDTTIGIPCCYSPRMEAKLAANGIPGADPEALADTVVTSFADRGGWPGSMDVGVFQPYYGIDGSFTTQYADEGVSIAEATGGTNTTYIAANATIDNIAKAIEDCGVVIFDSHGTTDYEGYDGYTSQANTSYLCLTTSAGITSEDTEPQTGPYGTYRHCMKGSGYAYVDGTCMTNHMNGDSPNGHVWMAICLGMATDGLEAPLRSRGAEVVYGYSQSVSFTGDYAYERYFWEKMKNGSEVNEAAAYMKQKVGNRDPYTNPPAYPIFSTSEDVYPGHGNVDKVQAVYSTWTLFTQYKITALANNEAWGKVSLSGSTITAMPESGYYIAGYEVVSGTATVTQYGSTFKVKASSDCTIRIDFAAKTPAVLNFSVPEGVTCAPINSYQGDDVVLPVPEGTVTAGEYACTFRGWTTEPVTEPVAEMPACLRSGTAMMLTSTEQTLYALYGYLVPEDVPEGQFGRVETEPASWEDDYVITYNGTVALDASGQLTGTRIGASSAVVNLADAGVASSETLLCNVPDTLVYHIVQDGNDVYTLKMKNSDYYLSVTSNADMLTTTKTLSDKCRWTISMEGDVPVLTNVAYPARSLQYNTSSKLFRAYSTGSQAALTLYAAAKGTTWFTTDPKDPNAFDAISITGQPTDFTGPLNSYATFHVEAAGTGLTYQWQSYTNGKWVNNSFATSRTDTLRVKITEARDGAQYRCVITDASGNRVESNAATLHVEAAALTITAQPTDYTGRSNS